MVAYDELYRFLRRWYKPDRFEGRNGAWCPDYSHRIARSYYDELKRRGKAFIPPHESISGRCIVFDAELRMVEQ